jgi:transposase-like protein
MSQGHIRQCRECKSTHIRKNGLNKGKQNYICVDGARQFITDYNSHKGYDDEFKREC